MLQEHDEQLQIAMKSIQAAFMSDTEQRYSQIEKETLGIVWSYEKFQDYVLDKHIIIETDHKPLVPLYSTTELANLSPHILRFRLKLSRFI